MGQVARTGNMMKGPTMYAHVTTYRLSTTDEVERERENLDVVSDQTARTLASWWHSPSPQSQNITALSHGLPFDTEDLRDEIHREITNYGDQDVLLAWVDAVETTLST